MCSLFLVGDINASRDCETERTENQLNPFIGWGVPVDGLASIDVCERSGAVDALHSREAMLARLIAIAGLNEAAQAARLQERHGQQRATARCLEN